MRELKEILAEAPDMVMMAEMERIVATSEAEVEVQTLRAKAVAPLTRQPVLMVALVNCSQVL